MFRSGAGVLNINRTRTAFSPNAITVSANGNLYVTDFSPKLLLELTPKGQVVNSWPIYVTTAGLATAQDGSILVGNYGNFAVDRIVNNQLTVLTAFKLNSLSGLIGTFRPSGVAVTSAGQVYADTVSIPVISYTQSGVFVHPYTSDRRPSCGRRVCPLIPSVSPP